MPRKVIWRLKMQESARLDCLSISDFQASFPARSTVMAVFEPYISFLPLSSFSSFIYRAYWFGSPATVPNFEVL